MRRLKPLGQPIRSRAAIWCGTRKAARSAISTAGMSRKSVEVADVRTWDEGQRVAANIVKLPVLLRHKTCE
jgi:hypothetical protein